MVNCRGHRSLKISALRSLELTESSHVERLQVSKSSSYYPLMTSLSVLTQLTRFVAHHLWFLTSLPTGSLTELTLHQPGRFTAIDSGYYDHDGESCHHYYTDQDYARLLQLTQLRTLKMPATRVRIDMWNRFATALPHLQVLHVAPQYDDDDDDDDNIEDDRNRARASVVPIVN